MTTGNLRLQEEALREERTELTAEFDAIIAKEKRSDEDSQISNAWHHLRLLDVVLH